MGWSIEQVWKRRGWDAWILSPLGALYSLGWWSYQSIYALRIKRPYRSKLPVVTVGNLIAGGAGKTPTTICIAQLLSASRQVVIGLSGYGFDHEQGATIAPFGNLDPQEWGDEPAMVRAALPDVPLVVGRDRVLASQLAEATFPSAILLMDDGFQHLRLAQDITLVIDPSLPNTFCLPAGPYREPRTTGRRRARLALPSSQFALETEFRLTNVDGAECEIPSSAQVLTAIARPERLIKSLTDRGSEVTQAKTLPDHHPMIAGTIFEGLDKALPVVVTAKDWIKLQHRGDIKEWNILVADTTVRITPEREFHVWLLEKLNETGR